MNLVVFIMSESLIIKSIKHFAQLHAIYNLYYYYYFH